MNRDEFCGTKPGTLWLGGAFYETSDRITCDAKSTLMLRENNWNFDPNPNGGWDRVTLENGESKYPDADFNSIQRES